IGEIYRLIDVLYELDKLDIPRIRISSIEPNLLNGEIISLVKSSEKFCKHFHIPLQSGDNEILKLMRRRYMKEDYEDLIYKLTELKRAEFYKKNIGKVRSVLFESAKDDGYIYGFTDNYIELRMNGNRKLENTIVRMKIYP